MFFGTCVQADDFFVDNMQAFLHAYALIVVVLCPLERTQLATSADIQGERE